VALPPGVLRGLTDFTVATWVNIETPTTWSRIFDFGTGTQVNMFLTPRSGDNTVRFAITNGGGGAEQRIDGTGPLPTGWTHVAVTRSGTSGTIYVNGQPVGTNPNLTLGPSDLAGGETANNWIGRSQYPDPLLDATVDDFHIYDRALSPDHLGRSWPRPVGDVERVPALDGLASADPRTRTARVIFGGGDGDIQLTVDGLAAIPGFGGRANVQVFAAQWTGTDGVSHGPVALFEGEYRVRHGRISIPVSGIEDSSAYLAVIRPDRHAPRNASPVSRYEAEAADHGRSTVAESTLASDNRYVVVGRRNKFIVTVRAPAAGAYDLVVRYTNPTGAPVEGSVAVGRQEHTVQYAPTSPVAPFWSSRRHVDLKRGTNRIVLRFAGSGAGVDHIDVTPFRARFEAESGQRSGANLVTIAMADSNFFAPYVSGDAYVADLAQPDSHLRLPVTVPTAGRYRLTIGYSTAGTEAERRAQIRSGHVLRVDDGPWQQVSYDPTQFRQMIRQTVVVTDLPAGTSTLTLAKGHPDYTGPPQPGGVDIDYVDVSLAM
jgi:hypothetical protein